MPPSHGALPPSRVSRQSEGEHRLTVALQSWAPANLYNLYQRTYGPPTADTKFTKSSLSMFQQKWKAKQLVRGYHGDWIQENKFKKDYLPDSLPPIIAGKGKGAAAEGSKVPLASMMFAEVEKRLDTVVFRCCFADSIYRARMMVVHGKVQLNGRKVSEPLSPFPFSQPHMRHRGAGCNVRVHQGELPTLPCAAAPSQVSDPNIRLQPGDLISVDPSAVTTLQPPKSKKARKAVKSSSPAPAKPAEAVDAASEPSAETSSSLPPPPTTPAGAKPLPFHLPDFASPFLFIPPYLELSFPTCSAIYLRHPTAAPGVSEVPSPYEADGEVMKLAWVSSPHVS